MNIVDAKALPKPQDSAESNFGVPVVVVIGLPLLALFIVLFMGFGLALQSQRTDLTKTYSKRTAESLARDLADQLGQLLTPAAEYADRLAATLEKAKCTTDECAFAIVRMQRAIASRIPQQVAYLIFGARNGQLFSIYKIDQSDQGFLGTVETPQGNSNQLII
jgi:hypothetical protein